MVTVWLLEEVHSCNVQGLGLGRGGRVRVFYSISAISYIMCMSSSLQNLDLDE